MGDFIAFPCSCCINEYSVLTMCITHDLEMVAKRAETRRKADEYDRMMLKQIERAIGRPSSGTAGNTP